MIDSCNYRSAALPDSRWWHLASPTFLQTIEKWQCVCCANRLRGGGQIDIIQSGGRLSLSVCEPPSISNPSLVHNGDIPRYTSPLGGSPSCYHYAKQLILTQKLVTLLWTPCVFEEGHCHCSGQTIVYPIDNSGTSTALTTLVVHRALSPIDNCNVILWFGFRAVR